MTTIPCPWTVEALVAAEDEPEESTAVAPVDALPVLELEELPADEPEEPEAEEEEVEEEVEIPGGGDWEVVPTEATATVEPPERVEGVAVTCQLAVSMPSACVKE